MCVCVCVREREGERQRDRERDRGGGGGGGRRQTENADLADISVNNRVDFTLELMFRLQQTARSRLTDHPNPRWHVHVCQQ